MDEERPRATGGDTIPRPPKRPLLIWSAVGLAVVAAVVVWLIVRGGDDDTSSSAQAPAVALGKPTVQSAAGLRAFGRAQAVPVYWAGARKGARYELTRTANGRIYIRYLPKGAKVGDSRPDFLTIGTYPQANAYAAVRKAGRAAGRIAVRTQSGSLVVYDPKRPKSVYFTFPGANFQVEVYDRNAQTARSLVLNGQVERLG